MRVLLLGEYLTQQENLSSRSPEMVLGPFRAWESFGSPISHLSSTCSRPLSVQLPKAAKPPAFYLAPGSFLFLPPDISYCPLESLDESYSTSAWRSSTQVTCSASIKHSVYKILWLLSFSSSFSERSWVKCF